MKLITEYTENDIQCMVTEEKGGKKNYVIEGVFAQAEKENRNKRFYPKSVLEPAVEKFVKEQVTTNRAVGELNHPEGPTVNLDKVSHRITEMNWDGDNVMGKALVLDTPMGNIVKGLLEGGCQLGVSTRGMGELEDKNGTAHVKKGFHMATVDVVQDPSAPDAFVNGIMEGVEWIWNNGVIQPQVIEKIETEIKKAPSANLKYVQEVEWQNFLSLLKSK